ncbi:CoA-binding protein [Desulfuribacillus stibiiarsenatis]|uniref:CoA-binding protein n=1 Tax=Desulfuribacillus stibiiarsenatis TaxID=1390249 RepID=A0A1E5L7U7_9FIRM|nr:CoA-binding protein [Desulfuribacillus stibiiarsenatis]OEH86128.1 CoA-binding protein [Desulfuribacillus stibiiarsenatis]
MDSDMLKILNESKTIAVVGLSDVETRPSFKVSQYMQKHGYRIIPVNPRLDQVLGEKAVASLDEIQEQVDIVNIFRKSEDVLPFVEKAIAIGAKTVWLQMGISNQEAEELARNAGLQVVSDKCIKIEHQCRIN